MLNMPFVAVNEAAATKNVCHGDDCRIEGSQKLLHKHFSVKYRFSFAKYRFNNNNNNNFLLIRRKYLYEYIQMRLTSYMKIIIK